jgi:hypothetical protein
VNGKRFRAQEDNQVRRTIEDKMEEQKGEQDPVSNNEFEREIKLSLAQ